MFFQDMKMSLKTCHKQVTQKVRITKTLFSVGSYYLHSYH